MEKKKKKKELANACSYLNLKVKPTAKSSPLKFISVKIGGGFNQSSQLQSRFIQVVTHFLLPWFKQHLSSHKTQIWLQMKCNYMFAPKTGGTLVVFMFIG